MPVFPGATTATEEEAEEAAVRLAETFGVNVREIIVRKQNETLELD